MRVITLGVGVLVFSALLTLSSPVYADDEPQQNITGVINSDEFSSDILSLEKQSKLTFDEWLELQQEDSDELDEEQVVPEPVKYQIQSGDSLIKIADRFDINWTRIWDKNTELEHPDELTIDDVLIIPFEEEELEERDIPQSAVVEQPTVEPQVESRSDTTVPSEQPVTSQAAPAAAPTGVSSGGNLYVAGYCTYYVKNRRGDLPNNLGNANTWVSRASAQGYSTGRTPRVGAVAYQPASSLGHVAYVEAVHNDGTVTVSEMNWNGWNVTSQRRADASLFTYIY